MMNASAPVRTRRSAAAAAWRGYWILDPSRRPSTGAQWLCTLAVGLAMGLAITVASLLAGERPGSGGLLRYLAANLVVSVTIAATIHLMFAGGMRWVGADRLRRFDGTQRSAFFGGLSILGSAIGWPLGVTLAGVDFLAMVRAHPESLGIFALLCTVLTMLFGLWFHGEAKKLKAERQAAEAQLRLLQGQIEPHFLFNTLANVLSLIDADPHGARRMLETFIDYLRASLGRLREEDGTLGDELALVQSYLDLLQMRMGPRLHYTIEADEAARAAAVPPMLLQPLVENAVHHGLEPKVEGGTVRVTARLHDGALTVEVRDDGLGPDAPRRRPARPGSGTGLRNIRERIALRYGPGATLAVQAGQPGAVARLTLPVQALAQHRSQATTPAQA